MKVSYLYRMVVIACAILRGYSAVAIEFNYDLLSVEDRDVANLANFAEPGHLVPGKYMMRVKLNKIEITEQYVTIKDGSHACVSPELIEQFAFKKDVVKSLAWQQDGCLDFDSVPGIVAKVDPASLMLSISLPQAYLEYQNESWDPPSRWDDGINGVLLDYNLQAQHTIIHGSDDTSTNYSGYGVIGANVSSWRLRADWNASRNDYSYGDAKSSSRDASINRVYAYKALRDLSATLTVGETSLGSQVIDGFLFTGVKIESNDNMLPPALRGYSPEVVGVARTNARVEIRQDGRVLYSTQVAQGPFRIQDIPNSVSGTLDVRVEEQDGTVQTFQVVTANIPYLTRPGAVRYNVAVGRPSGAKHSIDGPSFASGEFSWGVNNGWSLLGGAIASSDYATLALGFGRDLLDFGAISFDATTSRAVLPDGDVKVGNSYRTNYSKHFDELDSQVSFAGYRFSDRNYMNMNDFIHATDDSSLDSTEQAGYRKSKGMYNVTLSKQFRDLQIGANLGFTRQTYWDFGESQSRYNFSLSRSFSAFGVDGLNLSANVFRTSQDGTNDDGVYLSLSVPLGNGRGNVSYSNSFGNGSPSHNVSYSNYSDSDSYSLTAGTSSSGESVSGYYTHNGEHASTSFNASHQSSTSAAGMSISGGFTATAEGAAFHKTSSMGNARVLVDTDGVAGVPVRGYGSATRSNMLGSAVMTDVGTYRRSQVTVDVTELDDDVDVANNTMLTSTLTEGAIGYKHFDILSGMKRMATVQLQDGSFPPFGSNVISAKQVNQGIVGENGLTYIAGIKAGEQMTVRWSNQDSCVATFPETLPADDEMLTVRCQ